MCSLQLGGLCASPSAFLVSLHLVACHYPKVYAVSGVVCVCVWWCVYVCVCGGVCGGGVCVCGGGVCMWYGVCACVHGVCVWCVCGVCVCVCMCVCVCVCVCVCMCRCAHMTEANSTQYIVQTTDTGFPQQVFLPN